MRHGGSCPRFYVRQRTKLLRHIACVPTSLYVGTYFNLNVDVHYLGKQFHNKKVKIYAYSL